MFMQESQTTIIVNKETREQLKTIGSKGETYDKIISQLIELARQHEFYRRQLKILETERLIPLEKV